VAEVRSFEERAKAAGVAVDQVAAARYALCATIDEAVLSTPWGARGEWGTQPLLSIFHRETWGGEKFFQLLDRTRADPRTYSGLLELLYTCVSLGFTGKYALDPQGPMQRDRLQHELFEQVRSLRGTPAQPLSPRWQGVRDAAIRCCATPLRVVAAAAVALLPQLPVPASSSDDPAGLLRCRRSACRTGRRGFGDPPPVTSAPRRSRTAGSPAVEEQARAA
jgi:type VI secretion system protein ImpK